MKLSLKLTPDLQKLLEFDFIREDSLFLHKIVLFESQKQTRLKNIANISELSHKVQIQQESIIKRYEQTFLEDTIRSLLFGYCGKVYKIIKQFKHKLHAFAPQIADKTEIHVFLLETRQLSMRLLNDNNSTIAHFMYTFKQHMIKRLKRQLAVMQPFHTLYRQSVNSLTKTEQSIVKNTKYLSILKYKQTNMIIKMYLVCINKINADSDTKLDYTFIDNKVNNERKDESMCDVILNRYNCMLKSLIGRNEENNKQIEKYLNWKIQTRALTSCDKKISQSMDQNVRPSIKLGNIKQSVQTQSNLNPICVQNMGKVKLQSNIQNYYPSPTNNVNFRRCLKGIKNSHFKIQENMNQSNRNSNLKMVLQATGFNHIPNYGNLSKQMHSFNSCTKDSMSNGHNNGYPDKNKNSVSQFNPLHQIVVNQTLMQISTEDRIFTTKLTRMPKKVPIILIKP